VIVGTKGVVNWVNGEVRVALSGATEAMLKGEQNIRVKHVHVYAGGHAVVGNVNRRGGRGSRKNERPAYERSQDKPATCAVSDSPSVRSADQETAEPLCSNQARPSMPVTSMWVLGA
jgi:hypothetical protein